MEGFTPEQLAQLRTILKEAMREEMAEAGLRLDSLEHMDLAKEDFRFLRRLRQGVDGAAGRIGWVVIAAVLGGVFWLINAGLSVWKGS